MKTIRFAIKYLWALMGCLYLFSVGFFRRKNRDLLSFLASQFGFGKARRPLPSPLIPKMEIEQILAGHPAVKIFEPIHERGNVSLLELLVINQFIKEFKPMAIFEIGTFDGRTTLNMAANCEPDARVYTLDLPLEKAGSTGLPLHEGDRAHIEKERSGERYQAREEERKIVQLYGDSASFNFAPYYNKMDLVFIDGAHSYDYVLNDSKAALRLLRGGKGIILWHDYDAVGDVTQALNELYLKAPEWKGLVRIRETNLVLFSNVVISNKPESSQSMDSKSLFSRMKS